MDGPGPSLMKAAVLAVRQRFAADFRVGVYLVFGAMAFLILLPIAFVRFAQGALVQALVDGLIVAYILGATTYAWRGGDMERLSIVTAVVVTAGGCAVALLSPAGLYWLYPISMAIAFMVGPAIALSLCAASIGVLVLHGEALATTGQPLAVIASMATTGVFAAVFARRTTLRRELLEQMATIDALTGAENRRAFNAEVDIAVAAFRRDGRPVALALLDLDHFKRINDRYGHERGDAVLQEFVRCTRNSVRRTDRLFRYGGEEFVLLMPATDELGLELAMDHLRSRILEQLQVEGEPVTVSIGGAVLRHAETRDAWFGRADEALYRAKENGRNRVEIDSATP